MNERKKSIIKNRKIIREREKKIINAQKNEEIVKFRLLNFNSNKNKW